MGRPGPGADQVPNDYITQSAAGRPDALKTCTVVIGQVEYAVYGPVYGFCLEIHMIQVVNSTSMLEQTWNSPILVTLNPNCVT